MFLFKQVIFRFQPFIFQGVKEMVAVWTSRVVYNLFRIEATVTFGEHFLGDVNLFGEQKSKHAIFQGLLFVNVHFLVVCESSS